MVKALKSQKHNLLIAGGIFMVAMLILGVFMFVYYTHLANAGGQPAHSHAGYPCLNCGSTSSTYVRHLQEDLNWLHDNLGGFRISGGKIGVDGLWGGETENAVRNFQSYVGIQVDGQVGNQTWTYLEFWTMTAPGISKDASPHPSGVTIRYPIYAECRAITNNNGRAIASPLKTKAEWNNYKANAPNISNVAGNCSISSSGGTSGGTGSSSGGGGGSTGGVDCTYMCEDACPSNCTTSCSGCYSWQSCICTF